MRVPAPAAMSTGRDDSFAAVLEDATATRDEPPAPAPAPPADVDDELAELTPEITAADGPGAAPQDAEIETADETAAFTGGPQEMTRPTTGTQDSTTRRGERVRQATAGKGPDSPAGTSTAAIGQPLLHELVERGARNPQAIATGVTGPVAVTTNVGRPAGEPLLRGVEGAAQRGNLPPRAAATTAGYRTSGAATAQMLDHARESVFKQILLKLTPDGGEMRIRLDPPELGELDLRMVVEGGNRMSLAISAQRDDLADMLQQHIDELTTSLADVGIELTRTDVQSRHAGTDGEAAPEFARGDHRDVTHDIEGPKSRGYIRADGLDFWV